MRIDGSHDPSPVPLLLARARAAGARRPLALEPLELDARAFELSIERLLTSAPAGVTQTETNGERKV
jgi:hypothetical protein